MTFGRDSCNCCERLIAAIQAGGGGGGGGGTPAGPQIEGLATNPLCDADGNIVAYGAIQVDEATGVPTTRYFDATFAAIGGPPAGATACKGVGNTEGLYVVPYCLPNASQPAAFQWISIDPTSTQANPKFIRGWLDPVLNVLTTGQPANTNPCFNPQIEGLSPLRLCSTTTLQLVGYMTFELRERDGTVINRFFDTNGASIPNQPANSVLCDPLIPDEVVCYTTIGNGTEDVTAALSGPVQELGIFGGDPYFATSAQGWIQVFTDVPATTVGDNMSVTIPAGATGATLRFVFTVDVFEPSLLVTSGLGNDSASLRMHSFSIQPQMADGNLQVQSGVVNGGTVGAGGRITWPAMKIRELSFKVSRLPATPLVTPLTLVLDQMDFRQWRINAPPFRRGRMYRDPNTLGRVLFDTDTNMPIAAVNYRIVPCPAPADTGIGRTVNPAQVLLLNPGSVWTLGDAATKVRTLSMLIAPNTGSVSIRTRTGEREWNQGTLDTLGLGRNIVMEWGVDGDSFDRMLTGPLRVATTGDARVLINWTEERT